MSEPQPSFTRFPMVLDFDDAGHLRLTGDIEREAVCHACGEPIRWCLDMFSFTTGYPRYLEHARCAWVPGAFTAQARLAKDHPASSVGSSGDTEREAK